MAAHREQDGGFRVEVLSFFFIFFTQGSLGTCLQLPLQTAHITCRFRPQLGQFPALWLTPSLPAVPHFRGTRAGDSNACRAKVTPDTTEPCRACHLMEKPQKSVKIHKKLILPPYFLPFSFSRVFHLFLSVAPMTNPCWQPAPGCPQHFVLLLCHVSRLRYKRILVSTHLHSPQHTACPQATSEPPEAKQTPDLQPTAVP